jgi:transcriptional regulator of acetoin/glycerol metabolism
MPVSTIYNPQKVLHTKDLVLSDGASHADEDDPELLSSWVRSRAAIGRPENIHVVPLVPTNALDPYLADMFHAPLSRVSDDLAGSGIGVLLADARGRILQRWSQDNYALTHLDQLGTVPGAVLSEDAVGTNGVGTVAKTGKPMQVRGEEHFASLYSHAVCTGAPVFHPISHKLIAVITLSSELFDRSSLLKPLVKSVTATLEQHLLDAERPSSRRVLAEFLKTTRMKGGPVLAFGGAGFVMQSSSAEHLTVADLETVERSLPEHYRNDRFVLELSSGNVEVQLRPVNEDDGYIVTLDSSRGTNSVSMGPARAQLVGRDAEWLTVQRDVSKHREMRRPLLIAGEPATGKTSLAVGLPHRQGGGIVINAAERHVLGSRKWLQRVADRLGASAPVVVRGIETLDSHCMDALAALINDEAGHGSILLTMSTDSPEHGEAMAARLGISSVWVPPLRQRFGDVPLLWRMFTQLLAPGAGLEPRADTLELLSAYAWPGNLRELRSIVEQMAMLGKRGTVLPSDLPENLRSSRSLSMIERVELEAIRRALVEAEGNRSRAAEILGLSRATVYRKMRAYRLTV